MKRRTWDSKTKAKIVLEGLGGRPVAELCNAYEVSQTQYYKWRDQFLTTAHQAFENERASHREAQLRRQNAELKAVVGELTVELKKNEGPIIL
jgi:transposase-like protein